jgi:hypothetical protein
MTKLLGKVTLKNTYRVVLDSNGDYRVTYKTPRGALYSQDVDAKIVEYVHKQFGGTTVTVPDVEVSLKHALKTLPVPYAYGHKLQFYSQSVLLVLVAAGRASHVRSGPRFEYTILVASRRRLHARKK